MVGDVADKGVPAALVMASTRSMLRAAAQTTDSPGEALARVNDLLYADTLPRMFVTCFYAILDPDNGRLRFANAGQDLPYRRHGREICELYATGMPLGLMPGTRYDEQEVVLDGDDERILFYSDGLVEAHNPQREMFGFPRLKQLIADHADGTSLLERLLNELRSFTGEGWEQEDDVTLVMLLKNTGAAYNEKATGEARSAPGVDDSECARQRTGGDGEGGWLISRPLWPRRR